MYGENTANLRDVLATLLQITRRPGALEGLSQDEITLTAAFRTGLTVWCQQAVRASSPAADIGATPRTRGPAEELRARLACALSAFTAPLPHLSLLTTVHPNAVVDLWRRAAEAAALGEQDFATGLEYGLLSDSQAMTLLKDAAEITRVLTGLDRRYAATVRGWERIVDAEDLGRAAVVCVAHAGYGTLDYTIDGKGWSPPVCFLSGAAPPGLAGVLHAQNNLLFHLRHQPDAHSLRLIFDSQRIVSSSAVALSQRSADSQHLATAWARRTETYGLLIVQSRNLRGTVGTGIAAADGALAAARIRGRARVTDPDDRQLQHLDALFKRVDRRIASIVQSGAADRSYLLRVGIPRLDLTGPGSIKRQRARHVPLDTPTRSQLLTLVDRSLGRRSSPRSAASGPVVGASSFGHASPLSPS